MFRSRGEIERDGGFRPPAEWARLNDELGKLHEAFRRFSEGTGQPIQVGFVMNLQQPHRET